MTSRNKSEDRFSIRVRIDATQDEKNNLKKMGKQHWNEKLNPNIEKYLSKVA